MMCFILHLLYNYNCTIVNFLQQLTSVNGKANDWGANTKSALIAKSTYSPHGYCDYSIYPQGRLHKIF